MGYRLVCKACNRLRKSEDKAIGVIVHPDLWCTACGIFIRSWEGDTKSEFSAVDESDIPHIQAQLELVGVPDV